MGTKGEIGVKGKSDGPGWCGARVLTGEGGGELQTARKLGHKGLQDFVASPQAVALTEERNRACSELVERPGEEERKRPEARTAGPASSCMVKRSSCRVVLRDKGEEGRGALEIKELQDSEAAAWTVTRDKNSRLALLTLIDTGNQAVSCMPEKMYRRLCRL